MRCEKCGYENSAYDIICEKCGSPLNIEKNIALQKKYNHKQRAIDIEEIDIPENNEVVFDATKKKITNVLLVIVFFAAIIFIALIFNIIKDYRSRDILNQYNDFVKKSDLGVLYFGSDSDANTLLEEYSSSYNFNYLYINTKTITSFKRNRIKKDLKLDKIRSTVVIINKGETINWLDDYKFETRDKMIEFLQDNNIIPKYLGNPNTVIDSFNNGLVSETPMIIYYVSKKKDEYWQNNEKLRDFCDENGIGYSFVEGYYITDNQNINLLRKLNYNEIQDELLIIVDEEKVIKVLETVNFEKTDYFEIASSCGIIDRSNADSLHNITFNELKNITSLNTKNVIMFGQDECDYCDRNKIVIGKIGIQNNVTMYYYHLDDNTIESVEEYLASIGYTDSKITPPLVIVTENNSILDYVIGLSEKSLFEAKFKELGVIR